MDDLLGAAVCLAAISFWVVVRLEAAMARHASCRHPDCWKYVSLYGQDRAGEWTRHCKCCGYQEPCPAPEGAGDVGGDDG